jgi:glycosyltransferase involved in cell wall biosynthesis
MSLACICTNCDVRNYGHKLWRVARQAIQRHAGNLPGGIRYYISVTRFSEKIIRPYLPPGSEIFQLTSPVTHTLTGKPRNRATGNKMLFAGRISTEKGAAIACEAARKTGVQLIVVGEGPIKRVLQEKYPEVEFKGWLSTEKVFEEMLEAKALLFPSVCYETQGLTVLEALSVGLPVIVSDECAASEFVDQRNGFTFKSGDAEDLAAKMRVLTASPEKAEEMSRYAYEKYWEAPYLLDGYIQQTLDIYNTILEKERRIKNNP